MKKIVNATPHDITLILGEAKITFPKSGIVARVSCIETPEGTKTLDSRDLEVRHYPKGFIQVLEIPMVSNRFGEVKGLPEEAHDVMYIVSAMVLNANSGRGDLVTPNTGVTAERNDKGHIVAVRSFVIK
ncbi:MAG: hypothetical protein ACRC0G_07205 [Fusobacteriaceae bacterium]